MCKSQRRTEEIPTRDELWERKKPTYEAVETLDESRGSILESLENEEGPVFRFTFNEEDDGYDYAACSHLKNGERRQALLQEFAQKGYKVSLNFGGGLSMDDDDDYFPVPAAVFDVWPDLHNVIPDNMETFHISIQENKNAV